MACLSRAASFTVWLIILVMAYGKGKQASGMLYKGSNYSSGLLEVIAFLYLWQFVLGSLRGLGRRAFFCKWVMVGFIGAEEHVVSQGHDLG